MPIIHIQGLNYKILYSSYDDEDNKANTQNALSSEKRCSKGKEEINSFRENIQPSFRDLVVDIAYKVAYIRNRDIHNIKISTSCTR